VAAEDVLARAADWAATWTVHSTILLLAAWAVTLRRGLSPRAREITWRTALLGGVLTASFPATTSLWTLPRPAATPVAPTAAAEPGGAPVAGPPAGTAPAPAPPTASVRRPASFPWPLALWAAGVAVLLVRRHLAWRPFRAAVRGGEAAPPGPSEEARTLLRGLGVRRHVDVRVVDDVASPCAVGCLRPRIVLPRRALDLPPERLRALLAHEAAHVARRDAAWLLVERLVTLVLWFQPLHAVARRRLRECAEVLCDEAAARVTGDPLVLAESIADVARWTAAVPAAGPALGVAGSGRALCERVARLLEPVPSREGRVRRAGALVLAAALLATACFAPRATEAAARTTAATGTSELRDELEETLLLLELGPRSRPIVARIRARFARIAAELERLERVLDQPLSNGAMPQGDDR
jgi:beta-lactamase regulating signal transducer with metallopeptidase domain